MKFEVGQKWKSRRGDVLTICYIGPIRIAVEDVDGMIYTLRLNGSCLVSGSHVNDLVEPYVEPKYRPFANRHEFEPHRDKWAKAKDKGALLCRIGGYDDSFVFFYPTSDAFTYEKCFATLVFEDGTPFGIELK